MSLQAPTKTRIISGSTYILLPRSIVNDSRFDRLAFVGKIKITYNPRRQELIISEV